MDGLPAAFCEMRDRIGFPKSAWFTLEVPYLGYFFWTEIIQNVRFGVAMV
jgi:hypothetical protein